VKVPEQNPRIDQGVSVVVPVYRSTHTLYPLVRRTHDALTGVVHEIILVDDGSPSETWSVIGDIADQDSSVIGIRLGRNSGQHSALLAGVRAASKGLIVTIDDDLQNPPEEIPRLLERFDHSVDVVYGSPIEIAQKGWRRLGARMIRWVLSRLFSSPTIGNASSFRAFRADLRKGFSEELGPGVSLDALLAWSTDRFDNVEVHHSQREVGKSNYSLVKLLRFAFDTTTGFSSRPLQLAHLIGFITVMISLGVLAFFSGKALIFGVTVPGFTFLACLISIFGGVQLLILGVIGEYLARMHFRVMRKPSYFVAATTQGE
jgi:glycosyltransferase involved in cell wall biosynthesis